MKGRFKSFGTQDLRISLFLPSVWLGDGGGGDKAAGDGYTVGVTIKASSGLIVPTTA
jgi:hypothetical protein